MSKSAATDGDAERCLEHEDLIADFMRCPFHRFLNLEFVALEPGIVEVNLPFRQELVSNPDDPYIHGGVLSTLLDVAGDFAIATELGRGVPTIDMRIDFLRAARPEPLIAHARVVKLGRSVGVTDTEIKNSKDELLAIGRILYSTR